MGLDTIAILPGKGSAGAGAGPGVAGVGDAGEVVEGEDVEGDDVEGDDDDDDGAVLPHAARANSRQTTRIQLIHFFIPVVTPFLCIFLVLSGCVPAYRNGHDFFE